MGLRAILIASQSRPSKKRSALNPFGDPSIVRHHISPSPAGTPLKSPRPRARISRTKDFKLDRIYFFSILYFLSRRYENWTLRHGLLLPYKINPLPTLIYNFRRYITRNNCNRNESNYSYYTNIKFISR